MQSSEKKETVLVTGGSGYLASNCILGLLKEGYHVRTTLRTMEKKDQLLAALSAGGVTSFDCLKLLQAELGSDDNWIDAIRGCAYVLHVASPFPAAEPEDENEVIVPAREGTLRVLKIASEEGVKRVVLTSSFAAVGLSTDPKGHLFSEKDWTDVNTPLRAYIKSKVVAERAAWDFIDNHGGDLELTVINPVAIFGPVFGDNYSASIGHVLKGLIEGQITQTPPFTLNVVDVRDVAEIHITAMTHPAAKGERFLAGTSQAMSFYDIAELIRSERPALAEKIAELKPLSQDLYIHLSCEKARIMLGWNPRAREASLLSSLDTLFPSA